jgi:hypothetical protein
MEEESYLHFDMSGGLSQMTTASYSFTQLAAGFDEEVPPTRSILSSKLKADLQSINWTAFVEGLSRGAKKTYTERIIDVCSFLLSCIKVYLSFSFFLFY